MIKKDMIDIHRLVDDIHAAEEANRTSWTAFCKECGMGRGYKDMFWPWNYAKYVTGLYTLRAYLRGKNHRQNPPEELRDYNRSMIETGREEMCRSWNMEKHNQQVAEDVAKGYLIEEVKQATG